MKAILFALFVALLMVGCGESSTPKAIDLDDKKTRDKIIAEAIDGDTLQKRGKDGEELYYVRDEQTPYTGWAKRMGRNGQIAGLAQFKDGKMDGLLVEWYRNGQKKVETNYKDGKKDGLETEWYEIGQKKGEGNWKDDKKDGLWTTWYMSGRKHAEQTYEEGKLWTAAAWMPGGRISHEPPHGRAQWITEVKIGLETFKFEYKKCPHTNVKNGNGVVVWYLDAFGPDASMNASVITYTYKDGKIVDGTPGIVDKSMDDKVAKNRFGILKSRRQEEERRPATISAEEERNRQEEKAKEKFGFPLVHAEELDQFQESYKDQHTTSFSHVRSKNWFSFTAGKDGVLTKILLFGKADTLPSEYYGLSMSGFIRKGNPSTGAKYGAWKLSRDDILNQLSAQGLSERDSGWIMIRMRGEIPQEIGQAYFLVCNRIEGEKQWFGSFAFGEGNPYKAGRHWMNSEHDLVFRTYVGKSIKKNHSDED